MTSRTASPHSGFAVRSVAILSIIVAGLVFLAGRSFARSEEPARRVPVPTVDETVSAAAGPEKLVLAGGCFWGVQGVFQHVRGVSRAVSGYAGGGPSTAHYEIVSTGVTGHAESVEITYDPKVVTLGSLLQIFFSVAHDPTQLDGQGPDSGTQYRSAVFAIDAAQKEVVDRYIAELNTAHVFAHPVVTQSGLLKGFFPAERYHQDYLTLNPREPYIAYNDIPKVENLKRIFPEWYRETPVLVTASSPR